MLAFCNARGKVGSPKVVTPEGLSACRTWANAGVSKEGTRVVAEGMLRLAVAVQADGSYAAGRQIRLGFTKVRKIERLRGMLEAFPGTWKERVTAQGVTEFTIIDWAMADALKALLDRKQMPWWWLGLTPDLREAILDEAAHWDACLGGARAHKWTHYSYSSGQRQNIDVLQALATIQGRKTRITKQLGREHWSLSVKNHHLTRGGNLMTQRIPYVGDVVCLSVPSSFVVVRDGGIPVITGQCCNFGYPGGLGAEAFVKFAAGYGVIISVERGKALKQIWLRRYSEMVWYFEHFSNLAEESGDCFSFTQLYSNRGRGDLHYTNACNTPFQGLVADGAKAALYEVVRQCFIPGGSLRGARPVAFIHDEIILEGRPEHGPILTAIMVEKMGEWIGAVPIQADYRVMETCWTKE